MGRNKYLVVLDLPDGGEDIVAEFDRPQQATVEAERIKREDGSGWNPRVVIRFEARCERCGSRSEFWKERGPIQKKGLRVDWFYRETIRCRSCGAVRFQNVYPNLLEAVFSVSVKKERRAV